MEYGNKEELEYGRGGRKESDDLMLQLDSIIPGVLEPLGIGLRTISVTLVTYCFFQHQLHLRLQYHEQESLHPLLSLLPGGSRLFCNLKPSGREESRCLHSQPSPPLPLGLQHLVKELQEKLVYLHISMPI